MKKIGIAFGALILIGAMGTAAMAQTDYAVGKFDRGYLDEHPNTARELANNPGLVDNPEFLEKHHGLQEYLASHPEIRRELKHHPQAFMSDEWHHDVYGQGRPLASTDRYMDNHPEVAARLEKNPGLIDNPTFIAEHPGLHEYLQNHPVARREWKQHPGKYMSAEKKYGATH